MLKIITKIVLNIGIYVSVFCSVNALANEKNLTIKLAKPSFILPAFTGLYSEREASIAPEEYETAERLREMLDSDQKEAVLAELENFFDIELSLTQYQRSFQVLLIPLPFDQSLTFLATVLLSHTPLVRYWLHVHCKDL